MAKIESPSISAAENGVTVCYTEVEKGASKGTYDNSSRDYKTEVYTDIDEGFKRFKELFLQAKDDKDSDKD